jgi:hypothetical protein
VEVELTRFSAAVSRASERSAVWMLRGSSTMSSSKGL